MRPDQVEKYEILEEVGHGGMATVYRARDTRLDRLVALKLMHPHLRGATEARARFAREARTIARLRHPSILEIYDYSGEGAEGSEECFIATELLTGPTLKAFAERHAEIPAEIAACFGIAIVQALGAAHAAGVVHRDVKPENVLVHQQRQVKLTDFGIAQFADGQSMTSTGQILGSPGHMAPEQIEGGVCDARSDIFAVGTVLYLLATGCLPFTGRNPHQILKKIVDGELVEPLRVRPSIGGRLQAILLRCLAVDPARRYPDACALERDLTAFVAEVGIERPLDTLAEYLAQPDVTGARLREQTITRLIARGTAAQDHGQLPQAMECFNRVLALDDGNAEVLALVQRIGRRRRLRRGLVAGALAVAAVAGALGLVWFARPFDPPEIPAAAATTPFPSTGDEASGNVPVAVRPLVAVQEEPAPSNAEPSVPVAAAEPPPTAPIRNSRAEQPRAARALPKDTPRRVVFQPVPANVAIGIDGGPLRPFGPAFREVMLAPGEHHFRIVGAHECCIDDEFTLQVAPGPGVTTVARKLSMKPAGLYVVSNVPADVQLRESGIQGRSRSVISVPVQSSLTEKQRLRVTAEGYRDYTREVSLRAGRVETVEVYLEPIGESP